MTIRVFLFLFLLCGVVLGQSDEDYYKSMWRNADSLKAYGLPKSSMQVVQEICTKASNENNTVNYVRAMLYKVKLTDYYRNDSFFLSLKEMMDEEAGAEFPAKQFLSSLIGDMFWSYYETNKYDLLERTQVANQKLDDIKTWDVSLVVNQMIKYYLNSIAEPERLQQINIENYNDLLNEYVYDKVVPNGRKFRPTLYDFLAFKAVRFFSDKTTSLTRPAEQFLLNDSLYLSDAEQFSQINIATQDTFSFHFYTLKTLQEILRFHLKDGNIDALLDADLIRLKFVYDNSVNPLKTNLYLNTLEKLAEKYSKHPYSTMVKYYSASEYYKNGNVYDSEDNINDKFKTAHKICEDAIASFPESEGADYCRALITKIEEKSLGLSLEEYNIPNKPFRSLVTYRNINKLYFKILKTSYAELDEFSEYKSGYKNTDFVNKIIDSIKTRIPVQSFSVNLPASDDFRIHKTEIKIPSLPGGEYILLAGTDENFSCKENAVAYALINMNSISYIKRENNGNEYYVLDRETGNPLAGATVKIIKSEYDYDKMQNKFIKTEEFVTDKNGYFKFNPGNESLSYYLEISHKGQVLSTKGYSFGNGQNIWYDKEYVWRTRKRDTKPDGFTKTYFFTDRSIYRPGQTLYFKGIVLAGNEDTCGIKTNNEVRVALYDANDQKISEQIFLTNEYGTFNGSFTLPVSGRNGRMSIRTIPDNGEEYFSVEDYKRPKFEVAFNPVKGAYKLGENVTVKGHAISFSGVNINAAKVKYQIVRSARYPNWCYSWRSGYYNNLKSNNTVIQYGTTETDDKGEFDINFTAFPDETVKAELKPYFNYVVTADVTDINGETHSKETWISVGYNSLIIYLDIANTVNKNEDNIHKLITTNLNGEREPASGKIEIYKLKSPERAFRDRLWDKPDKFVMTRDEYYGYFPYDEYYDESDFTKWGKEMLTFEHSFNTETDSVVDLNVMKVWNQGKYVAEISAKDKFGIDVKEIVYFDLYSTGETDMPYSAIENLVFEKRNYEPGETAKILFGTSMKNTKVLFEVKGMDGLINSEWLTFDASQRLIELPVKESYRGSVSFNFTFVKAGRFFSKGDYVSVPYTNKMLDISFNTFRNKVHPGDNEEWTIKIKDKNGIDADAEMVATLYDASLDDITKHDWYFDPGNKYFHYYMNSSWYWPNKYMLVKADILSTDWNKRSKPELIQYDKLNRFNTSKYIDLFQPNYRIEEIVIEAERKGIEVEQSGRLVSQEEISTKYASTINQSVNINIRGGRSSESIIIIDGVATNNPLDKVELKKNPGNDVENNEIANIKARKDFRETAFFKPDLRTGENGDITIKFEIPEALTKWKFIGFAHTKDLKSGMITKEFVTQKELMVTPNVPRYLREDDKVVISAKINNLSEKDLIGNALLVLSDVGTMKNIDTWFNNTEPAKRFDVKKDGSAVVSWEIRVPYGFEAVDYKIVAKAENFSDGEEAVLPVLTNRMLVTETMPMNVRGNEPKKFSMDKLINNNSNTRTNYCLTLEFTSNPAWYALLSLPYLMEFPHECAEQMFSRVYANSIASHIVNSNPKIKEIFNKWKETGSNALTSDLEKNEELKSLMLQETPWVIEAKNNNERKLRIGYLFELNRMSNELDRVMRKLKKMQASSGGWPWFEGGMESRYITQHIAAGLGKLYKLGIRNYDDDMTMVRDAIKYLDNQIGEDYDYLQSKARKGNVILGNNHLDYSQIHYLYMRSFFMNVEIDKKNKEAFDYYLGQAAEYWNERGLYAEGMIALALNRFGDTVVPKLIVNSLKERSTNSEDLGMYWKSNNSGYYWYEAPIETQALMIEVFDEVAKDEKSVDDMRVWLLKNKQTNDWKTTKATVEAVYALLLNGDNLLVADMLPEINVGNNIVDMKDSEAGTGYIKTNWKWGEIKPEMGNVTVSRKTPSGISWGSLYWQYFEDLDKIDKKETNLKIEKKLFVVENTGSGEALKPVEENLKVGDKVRVRIELRTDRDMEFVQMKDLRAAGFEPINVLSAYKYQDGLGYYESTRDAATYFFFDYLRKGTYVFEYDLRVNLKGDFSNGITSIQCMYAPEFASHSEGVRVVVGN
ncbi:MAG: alpha-2-macroglobulin family protein [Ignavibacteria bacterium]|nr:alpha-2-macroglobulin family protein [Ignavibacteria bacterium]